MGYSMRDYISFVSIVGSMAIDNLIAQRKSLCKPIGSTADSILVNMESRSKDPTMRVSKQRKSTYGEWMTVIKPRRQLARQIGTNTGEGKASPPVKTANQMAEIEAGIKEGTPRKQGSKFSILTKSRDDLNELLDLEIRSTNLGGNSQENHISNKSHMPQTTDGGSGIKSKGGKLKIRRS